jgi:NTE family protein
MTAEVKTFDLEEVKRVLILGGGAPNFTLMSGALLALDEAGLKFDHIYMAGAGAVVGLVYLSPKGLTPRQALKNTMNFGVSDAIYDLLPINYKLFSKSGPSADAFRMFWHDFPPAAVARNQYGMNPAEKLGSDLFLMTGAMISPTDLNYFSQGICAHAPFIEDIVDFDKLYQAGPEFYLAAYCIEMEKMEEFRKPEINLNHFRAALSYPFIYAPYQIGEKHYYEGASVETLGLIEFANHTLKIPRVQEVPASDETFYKVVLMDVMKPEIIQQPRDLWDAFTQSIMIPLVANAEKELAIFRHWLDTGDLVSSLKLERRYHDLFQELADDKKPNAKEYLVDFCVPEWHRPYLLDWTNSNLECLFAIGYEAGQYLMETEGNDLLNNHQVALPATTRPDSSGL